MPSARTRLVPSLLVASLLFVPRHAVRAATPNDDAERLFQEAKKLMDAGDYVDACPKLVESQRLHPGAGTLLALALCREGEGNGATAMRLFRDALAAAQKAGRTDRVAVATEELAKLEKNVSRLFLVLREADLALAGLSVLVDDVPIPIAEVSTGLPVDRGAHRVVVRADGRRSWSITLEIKGTGDSRHLDVPALERAESAVTTSPSLALPVALLGFGVVGLGLGGIYGARALKKTSDYKSLCPGGLCTDGRGVDLHDQAKSASIISTIGFGAGALLVGGGLVLLFSRGPQSTHEGKSAEAPTLTPKITPEVGFGHLGVTFGGSF